MDETKRCRVCGETTPLTEFDKAPGCVDGRRGECGTCFQAAAKARKDANGELKEAARQRSLRWREQNPERDAENLRRFEESGGTKRVMRTWHLGTRYGLTPRHDPELLFGASRDITTHWASRADCHTSRGHAGGDTASR